MPYQTTIKPLSILAGYTLATLPTVTAVGVACSIKANPFVALALCFAALVVVVRCIGRRFCIAALLLSLLFGAYYLPPYGSLDILPSYRMVFALFVAGNLQICLDRNRLKYAIATVSHRRFNMPVRYVSAAIVAPGSVSDRQQSAREASCRRILYIDHTATLSGGELALLNLIVSLNRERFVPLVALFAEGPLATKLREADVETHILPLAPTIVQTRKDSLSVVTLFRVKDVMHTLAHVVQLARFMRRHQIDLVHTNSLKADVIGGFAARLARVPVLWHVRDRIDNDYLPSPAVSTFRWLCRRIPNYVVTNSRATLATLRLKPSAPSAAIPSGARYDRFRQLVQGGMQHTLYALSDRTEPQRAARVGVVGRLSPWKGQHIFLQAAALVRQQFPNTVFQIIGAALFDEQAYEAELKELVKTLQLEENVEFTGFRPDVTDLIAGLDLLVHASTIAEPFGQVIIEGMAAGKPIVATDGGGVPEIVQDGVTGLLVPMGNARAMAEAICRLLADPVAARKMGELGFQRGCENFTIEHTARQVEQVYELILKE